MRYALLFLVLVFVGIAFPPDGSRASGQEPAPGPAPSPGGGIAFTSDRSGNYEIYVMNSDGTNLINLTNNWASDGDPTCSPDGSKIAFASDRDGNLEIYVMNSDGTNQTRLTDSPARDSDPAWSPDGEKIAFTSWRDGNGEVYLMNSDGTNPARLTNDPGTDQDAAWSPDGSKIAFQSDRDGHDQIYVMNSDGTNQTRLSNTQTWDLLPSWSPDGSKITFTSNPNGDANFDIYVINSDGTNPIRLTNDPAHDAYSRWSPDGEWIVFHSSRDGNSEIYVMRADGTNQMNLTNNPAFDGWPSWSPAPVSSPTPVAPAKEEATLEITSDPSGAAAKVNGWEAGITPLTMDFNFSATATQECTVILELAGYETWSSEPFTMKPGDHKTISAKLVKVAPVATQGKIVFAFTHLPDDFDAKTLRSVTFLAPVGAEALRLHPVTFLALPWEDWGYWNQRGVIPARVELGYYELGFQNLSAEEWVERRAAVDFGKNPHPTLAIDETGFDFGGNWDNEMAKGLRMLKERRPGISVTLFQTPRPISGDLAKAYREVVDLVMVEAYAHTTEGYLAFEAEVENLRQQKLLDKSIMLLGIGKPWADTNEEILQQVRYIRWIAPEMPGIGCSAPFATKEQLAYFDDLCQQWDKIPTDGRDLPQDVRSIHETLSKKYEEPTLLCSGEWSEPIEGRWLVYVRNLGDRDAVNVHLRLRNRPEHGGVVFAEGLVRSIPARGNALEWLTRIEGSAFEAWPPEIEVEAPGAITLRFSLYD